MDPPEYKNVRVLTGNSAFQVITKRPVNLTTTVIIIGPTGSGKSSFIEALIGNQSLGLSKNQLEGFTQEIAGYQLGNIMHRNHSPIFIIDTPGFADRKLSELEIVSKLKAYLELTKTRVDYILYFTPITDIRFSGSRKRVFEMFRALAGYTTSKQTTLVTTMWDQLHTDTSSKLAELRYRELAQRGPWQVLLDKKANIGKFWNTQESAFQILDIAFTNEAPYQFNIATEDISGDSPYFVNLVSDLDERIQQLCYQERNLLDDLEMTRADKDIEPSHTLFLEQKVAEVVDDMERFVRERVQLEGIKKRSEMERIVHTISRDISSYASGLKKQIKSHDWDTNQPFQPLPPPDSWFLIFPITPPSSEATSGRNSLPASDVIAQKDKEDQSMALIGSVEERMKDLQREVEQLKQHLSKTVSVKPEHKPQRDEATASKGKNWLSSVRSWRDARMKK